MKRFFFTRINPEVVDLALLVVRIFVGLTMLTHGYPKFGKLTGEGPMDFGDPLNIGPGPSLVLTVFAEFICSFFIIAGLGTRLAVIPLMITMLVAAFVVHQTDGFGKQEMAVLYLLIYFILFMTGSGKYSIDRVLEKKWLRERVNVSEEPSI
jgi:putative oxidoreductase